MALALTGPWRAEHLFVLKHVLARFECYTTQLSACDAQIARAFAVLRPRVESAVEPSVAPLAPPPPRHKPHSQSQNTPAVNTRAPLLRITGVDLGAVHGIRDAIAQTLLPEIGTVMSQGPDAQHCCAWLGRAPPNALAGGKVLKSRPMKNRTRAAQAFRRAAQSGIRSHWAFGAFSRRLQGRLGPAQALVATAHTIARPVYHMRKPRVPSHDSGAAEYTQRVRERARHYLQKKAAKLGYQLSPA